MTARARELGLAIYFDGEPWRNQFGLDDRNRKLSFRELAYDLGNQIYDADGGTLDRIISYEYVATFLEAQLDENPDIIALPGHVGQEVFGQSTYNDLRLAQAGIKVFRDGALDLPGSDFRLRPRKLYATIAAQAQLLDTRGVALLAEAFGALTVDGYFLNVFGYKGSQRAFNHTIQLAHRLQTVTGRPVIVSGLGHLWIAALAGGVAATVIGPQRLAPEFKPQPIEEEEGDPEFGAHVIRGQVLGGFSLDDDGKQKLCRSLELFPCRCGFHDERSFSNKAERWDHNVSEFMREGLAACSGTPDQAIAELLLRIESARENRIVLGMSALKPAWNGITPLKPGETRRQVG